MREAGPKLYWVLDVVNEVDIFYYFGFIFLNFSNL